ncbi:hypothetical protein Pedsa_3595 [Pseudopedobacter saltans DSM 12145]|uniref:SdpI/YhfL protein family n=1 Tax=Pseudopedobacter saltans (strain ATCC 51119 / DSM 12145 / JCM 21818 / CCUG 39354 / LMG 10337 / NBRC 100064 / NCIMB 13643) TaxID=762903 RepID=F0S4V0_PSESL|nr:SdpI family protein [Pseudopedobacter saltans]ADY54124.1 hypothetical protein Pedsa_3595 [Pseudopedobacter saltans DSM 12145]
MSLPSFYLLASSGVIFIICGLILIKYPPKSINAFYGYRTRSSMKTLERWNFSQVYSAREMIRLGSIMLIISLISLISPLSDLFNMITCLATLALACIALIFKTERAIKKKFGHH